MATLRVREDEDKGGSLVVFVVLLSVFIAVLVLRAHILASINSSTVAVNPVGHPISLSDKILSFPSDF